MLFCPSLYAATLTANTVPYVCQGGTAPQLCNSNMTTDSNGNLNVFQTWTQQSFFTVYQAPTDLIVMATVDVYAGDDGLIAGITDSNPSPSTYRQYAYAMGGPDQHISINVTFAVKKNDYYEVIYSGSAPSIFYVMPIG